jgi:peptidyl-prolyl cis-trans isomerase D
MLQFMRKHARNWMMQVLLGLVIVVFIFYFGSLRGGREADAVAELDGKQISYTDFRREYANTVEVYRQMYGGSLTEEALKKLDLKQQVLDGLIDQAVVSYKVRSLNVQVSDEEVKNAVLSYPAFQRGGVFDKALYEQRLRHFKMTPQDFEENQKKMIAAAKIETWIRGAAKTSDREVFDVYRIQNEKINLEYLRIPSGNYLGRVKPEESELEKYLKDNPEEFRVPEKLRLKYILFTGADFAGSAKVSDEEITEYYNRFGSKFAARGKEPPPVSAVRDRIVAEIRRAKGSDEAFDAAKKARTVIYQEENFEEYAKKIGLAVHATDLFAANRIPAELQDIKHLQGHLTGLQKDDLTPVISSPKGFYLFKVAEAKPSYVPALREVKEEVRKKYTERESARIAQEEAQAVLDSLRKGEDFLKTARSRGLKAQETGLFAPGEGAPKIGAAKDLNQAVFQISEKNPYPSEVFRTDGDFIVVRFKGRAAVNRGDFERKKDAIRSAYLRMKENIYYKSWMDETKEVLTNQGKLKILKNASEL